MTAVTTVADPHEQILATLDSLARSRLRDFELVVVDWSEGEQNRRLVTDWISAHPAIASRLVVADVATSGAARNIGLDFARGAFVLILAPGQELYPRCLGALTRTLEATEAAFAYPIQEVTGDPDGFVNAGGDYLLSYLEWDPGRVCARNDIHAPALIRTDPLRRLGGFATDPRLAGFEDYDIWCRMAQRGWQGQLVPQALARRPESASSRGRCLLSILRAATRLPP